MVLGLGLIGAVLLPTARAEALEEVKLSFSGFQFATIAVRDLTTFSETGQLSPNLASLLGLIKVDRDTALQIITQELPVNGDLLNDASHTFVGESFFQLIGTSINSPNAATPSWMLLREAVLTAATDNKVNALEVLQAFEATSVTIDTERVGQVMQQIRADTDTLKTFFDEGLGAANPVSTP